jgi:hypothetical protein
MRTLAALFLGLGLTISFLSGADAGGEKKEVKLKGKITCAKCDLMVKDVTDCMTVIVVKEKNKDIVYYFDKAAHKKYHDDICPSGMKGTVTGTVSKEGEKRIINVKDLVYDK